MSEFSTLFHTTRRLRRLVFSGLVGTLAVACGGQDRPAANGEGAARTGASRSFKVALLTPGPISDQSWNGGAYDGLKAIRDTLGAQISHIQTKTPAEFEENFRQYGAQGYTLVFGHGFEFQEAALRVAPSHPKTLYVTTSGNSTAPNVAGMTFAFEEASYLAGMLAGAMTKTDVVGSIGGTELPPVKASFAAFAAGAKAVNPRVRVLTSYIGNWDDVSAGKEQALAQIGQRADVLFQNADAAGLGVFQAAKERNVYAIGSNANQNAVAPEVVLGSVVIDLPRAFLAVAREVQAGTFTPRVVDLGMKAQVVLLVLNPQLQARIPAAIRTAIDTARVAIEAGTLKPLSAGETYSSASAPSVAPSVATPTP